MTEPGDTTSADATANDTAANDTISADAATSDDDWLELTGRAAFASHRMIGWIYWDPVAIERYTALGPEQWSYYVASRGAALADAGNQAVAAAFYSIHPGFIAMSLDNARDSTTFEHVAAARDAGVVAGLRELTPEICGALADMAPELWAAADALPMSGRVLAASLRGRPRPDDQLLSAWLAVDCIREWRGDTHWAIQLVDDLSDIATGILDGAARDYPDDWLPRSRGADDAALHTAFAELEARGLAADSKVNAAGLAHKATLEARLDALSSVAWRALGADTTRRFIELIEPVGDRFVERIDATAGPNWMPAARSRVAR
jgi:hypothetical protein